MNILLTKFRSVCVCEKSVRNQSLQLLQRMEDHELFFYSAPCDESSDTTDTAQLSLAPHICLSSKDNEQEQTDNQVTSEMCLKSQQEDFTWQKF